jgi:hypothetical protein
MVRDLRGGFRGASVLLAFLSMGMALGCTSATVPADDLSIEWSVDPARPVVGHAADAGVTLASSERVPVRHAAINLEAHMSHPGMAPVIVRAPEQAPGVYRARLTFTMAGDWIVYVSGSLPDGRVVRQRAAGIVVGLPE